MINKGQIMPKKGNFFCKFLRRGVRNTPGALLKLLLIENSPFDSC